MLKLTDTLTNENCRPTTGWVYLASSATPAEEKTSLLCLVRSEDFYRLPAVAGQQEVGFFFFLLGADQVAETV